jgi:fumarate hydratase class II
MTDTRTEEDTMGEVEVPADAYYGAQTQRAARNFPVSGDPMPTRFVRALGLVKLAAARVNGDLDLIEEKKAEAIIDAAQEVARGEHDDQFPVDVFQTGSGTSSNMNANEVVANRATEILGGELGSKLVHPNDDVNYGQSSNDVVPTAFHVAAVTAVKEDLLPALEDLQAVLEAKAEEFDDVVKIGRTHLMDATPVRLGQEFSGWGRQVEQGVDRVGDALEGMRELAIGGTAVGTGLNTHEEFGARVAGELSEITGADFEEARNHFEAQGARDAAVHLSGALNTVAASLMKIANDLRLLGSGPRTGVGEVTLPAIQPGSSIMPGKVNPVIPESVVQVGAQVNGNHQAITVGGQWGQLDLNAMKPLIVRNTLESIDLLANAAEVLRSKCLEDVEANEEVCAEHAELSTAIVTALNPLIGYDRASKLAKQAFDEGRTVREVAYDELEGEYSREEIDEHLDVREQTERGL